MSIKWQVRKLAENRGLTVSQLAEQASIAPGTATSLWHGRPLRVDLPTLERICTLLNCTPGDVLVLEQEGSNGVNSSSPLRLAA
jgi:putative transcriptional regulator